MSDSNPSDTGPGSGEPAASLDLAEFQRQVRDAEGNPEQISALVKALALGVIGEVRQRAARGEVGGGEPDDSDS